jgi:Polyketide cyclase / dehydrase and lipid transport
MEPIDSGRVTRRYVQHIDAPPERVFPLLCPVREREWLHGWTEQVEMVHSDSGVAEEGCVFRTAPPGRPDAVWMIVRHDREQGVVEFARVTTGLLATRLLIHVEEGGDGASLVRIDYTFTPLGAAGRSLVEERHSEEAFRRDMAWWEASMNHWLRSGGTLHPAALAPATA